MLRRYNILVFTFALLCTATAARAELPAAETVLADLGYSPSEIADIKAGKIVTADAKPVHDRDLAAAFAFQVPVSPAELVKDLKAGLLADVDPTTLTRKTLSPEGKLEDFATVTLSPDADKRAKRYLSAKPGDDLNLSA